MATTESAAGAARSLLGADVRHPPEEKGEERHSTAQALARGLERGHLALPLPGGGLAWERWEAPRRLGGSGLSPVRLAEGRTLARCGAVVRDTRSTHALPLLAAQQIDEDPDDRGGKAAEHALWGRPAVAALCWSVLDRSAEALGAGAFASDACCVRASADLSVYIRQHHGGRDLARLGTPKARREREAEDDLSRTPDPVPH